MISSPMYVTCLFLNLLPRMFRTSANTAIIVSLMTAAILLAALLLVGAMPRYWAIVFPVAMQLLVGLCIAARCAAKRRAAREDFALTRRTRFAAEQNRSLLHALIPKEVVDRLSPHAGEGLLGGPVRACAVMFCSLRPRAALQAAATPAGLGLLDAVFCAFDLAVADAGMFKYQHVGCDDGPARPSRPSRRAGLGGGSHGPVPGGPDAFIRSESSSESGFWRRSLMRRAARCPSRRIRFDPILSFHPILSLHPILSFHPISSHFRPGPARARGPSGGPAHALPTRARSFRPGPALWGAA